MDTNTVAPATITKDMVDTLSTEVQAVVDALATDNSKGFTTTVAHIGKVWGAVAPIYDIANGIWHKSDKNSKGTDLTPARFFDTLEATGTFTLDKRFTREAVMATRHHTIDAVADYQGEEKGFFNVSGYLRYLVKIDRLARSAQSTGGLTDAQKASLANQRMGNEGAGYLFDAMIPQGSSAEMRTQVLLAIVNDAMIELASCKVVLGDDGYAAQQRAFNKTKARIAGIVKS
jgi:hypothetical protein